MLTVRGNEKKRHDASFFRCVWFVFQPVCDAVPEVLLCLPDDVGNSMTSFGLLPFIITF